MAIVQEYIMESGVTILINDDAYRSKTSDEREKTKKSIDEVISQLIYAQAAKRA